MILLRRLIPRGPIQGAAFALLSALLLPQQAGATGPPGGVDVHVVNSGADPVPVAMEPALREPIFLTFQLSDPSWRSEPYAVPEGKRLEIQFAGAKLGGSSAGTRDLSTAVALRVEFPNGAGASCNQPFPDGTCRLSIPVLPLNNSETGANMGTIFPSAMGPVSIAVPAGATVESRLSSTFGAPSSPATSVSVDLVGYLVDESP